MRGCNGMAHPNPTLRTKMIAQVYSDEPTIVRLFEGQKFSETGPHVADIPVVRCTRKEADDALWKLRLRRKARWRVREYGFEAVVNFP